MHPTTRTALRLLAVLWLCALLGVLAACGGGGDDPPCDDATDPPPSTQPVNCKTHPERCV